MNLSKKIILLLAFLEGCSVMAIELLGGKMAAVFYGNSLYIWTSILGITIFGLAAGYYLGGKLSQNQTKEKILFYIFMGAAFLVALMPGWGNLIMKMTMVLGYQKGVIVSCLLFLTPPMAFLGMIPPTLINLHSKSINDSGSLTGTLFAMSTIGGIISVIITGFFVIPSYGFKTATCIIAVILAIIPFIYFIKKTILVSLGILFTTSFIIMATLNPLKQPKDSHIRILHKSDGLMGQLIVADDLNSQKRSLLVNNISQSFIHVPTRRSPWRYVHRLSLYSSFMPAGSSVLLCGIGGGSVANEMINLGFNVDAVDLDNRMDHIARKYFKMARQVSTFADDARHYIRTCKKKYDIVILDISAGENQPSNVYTIECFREIKKILSKNGIVFIHYQNVLKGESSIAVKSLAKTLNAAGFHTNLINTDKIKPDGSHQNWEITHELMLFGSKNKINLNKYSFDRRDKFADPFRFPIRNGVIIEKYSYQEGIVLTDNKPIMDVFHTNTLKATRGATLEEIIPILIKENIEII